MADEGEEEEDYQNGYDRFDELQLSDEAETDSSSSDTATDGDDSSRPISITYDPAIPTRHQYLGEEMDEFSGRTVIEPGQVIELPLMPLPTVVLVPGQTIPLHLFQSQFVTMMQNVIDKDRTFGLVQGRSMSELQGKVGTTVEIFSRKEEVEAGITTLTIKAMGRQRFKILSLRTQVDGILQATVNILPEILLSPHPEKALASCFDKFGCQATCSGSLERYRQTSGKSRLGSSRKKKINASLSSWPAWVYKLYDPFRLMDEIKLELQRWSQTIRLENVPADPIDFSYWVAANLPLDDTLKIELLNIDCTTQRLRKELDIMHKCSVLCCRDCNSTIAYKTDLFCMSLDGPLAAYVNPHGWVHETLTFYKATGVRLRGRPTAENSWFPGYAWTIAECQQCVNHLGWRFTSVKKGLTPSKFWGLTRASLKPGMRADSEEELPTEPTSPPPFWSRGRTS
ncbi:protein cereblon [Exaiptasia diaphana]|uniref:Protein cereblon n=1 Tax=Exaiptasia diaphana TaxID=2652724 RepID=A0A913XUI4_EXADI|nr:protein cereblon [Exaiptasia diaphana]KXJ24585.1 Protein cereblon [Exaiptasia diaphana]